ncbi:MAG: hypothetical protein Q8M11_22375 [Sulfuritalea sp.]|nr:hypothetical protein [Sulfuritalea sp.]
MNGAKMKPCLSLIVVATVLATPVFAWAADEASDLKVPSGVDYIRARMLGRGEPMKVYVNMVGIVDAKDERLLFPRGRGDAVGTHQMMNRRFIDTVHKTQRFEVYDDTSGGVRDKSDLVVDGMVVAATQNIENFTATQKSVTTVRLSLQFKDTSSGKLIKARTITGVYGDLPGQGTLVRSEAELARPEVRNNLANDYEKALSEALENAAAFLERTIRPLGRVKDIDGETVLLIGGQAHGIKEGDKMVLFRAKTMRVGDTESFGIMKPVGVAVCGIVTTDSSQCEVKLKGREWPPQNDDYAVLADDSLKLKED